MRQYTEDEILRARLKARLKEDETTVQKRLANAAEQLTIAAAEDQEAYNHVILKDDMPEMHMVRR